MTSEKLTQLQQAVVGGKKDQAIALTEELLAADVGAGEILYDGLIAGMNIIGERFKSGDCYVPEMLLAARAMQHGLDRLRPTLVVAGIEPIATVVIGTVQGDLHDIGKNLTGMFLEGVGFKVVDLGVNVSAQQFIDAVRTHKAQVLGMSALLTTTMTYTTQVVDALKAANMRDQVKVIVGGAPITAEWAARIGADAFAVDAASGADRCRELVL